MGNLEIVKEKAKPFFEGVHDAHDWFHSVRVHNLARHIAEEEGADVEVCRAAAYLHDIARKAEEEGEIECHAEGSAEMCVPILEEAGYEEEFIEEVQHCIEVHRYTKGKEAETLEAKIVKDADRLEAIGATVIARVISYGGSHDRPIHDPSIEPNDEYNGNSRTSINLFYEKTLKIKPETFRTETAQEMAKGRYEFMKKFLDRFLDEWEGKK